MSTPPPVCARHPDRPTGLSCVRCGRPACPECLRDASVGSQCVDCVAEGARTTRPARSVAGAVMRSGPARPLVVPALIAVNLAVFVATVLDAGSVANNDAGPLFASSALVPYAVAGGQWWRLVTSGFLHYGLIHIAFNMIALWVIGRDVEMILGRLRFGLVYAAALLGGSTAVMLLGDPGGPAAGASGAVFGLMGALVVLLRRMRMSPGPALTVIGINVAISFLPGISLLAHLGGLVVGAALTAGFVYGPARSRPAVGFVVVAAVVVVLLLAVGLRDLALGPVYCQATTDCRIPLTG